MRQEFLADWIVPLVPGAAIALVDKHLEAGDLEAGNLVVMTTASNRFITELTAIYLKIEHQIATEPEQKETGFTGHATGALNMREGKVTRLHDWMKARGLRLKDCISTAYSDSINDLPLLQAVNQPVAVSPDARLSAIARSAGWPVVHLH